MFVCVPTLPKNAAVEVQVIALEDRVFASSSSSSSSSSFTMNKWRCSSLSSSSYVDEVEETKMRSGSSSSGGGSSRGSSSEETNGRTSSGDSCVVPPVSVRGVHVGGVLCVGHASFQLLGDNRNKPLRHGLTKIMVELGQVLRDANMSWTQVNQLQCYYSGGGVNSLQFAAVRECFLGCWRELRGEEEETPALSFVPVLSNHPTTATLKLTLKAFDIVALSKGGEK